MECEKCKAGTMQPAKVFRLWGGFAAIGYVLIGASLVLLVFVVVLGVLLRGSQVGIGFPEAVLGLTLILSALLLIVIGLFLARRKMIWRCDQCGWFWERV